MKTTKITATFLAVVLVTGALTFGMSILVDDAFASGDKRDKKHKDRYYDDYDKKDRYYDDSYGYDKEREKKYDDSYGYEDDKYGYEDDKYGYDKEYMEKDPKYGYYD